MAGRLLVERLEFYITNVCNLTCNGCNRYNNYNFKGWQSWWDYKDNLEAWAQKIEIAHPVILGGEPLLNPTIVDWITGLRRLWPRWSGVQVQSNGTRINDVKGLYEALDNWNWLGISIHDPRDKELVFDKIRHFMTKPIIETANKSHPIGSDYQFYDANHKWVHCWVSDKFVQSNIIELPQGGFTVYNSDPHKAHANCTFRQFKNYHWIKGKIYKCGPVALMPEFDQQHGFEISDNDRQVMHSYPALTVDMFDTQGRKFFKNIDNPIPQCKFCPEHYDYRPITFSDRKKSWRITDAFLQKKLLD